MPAPAARMKAMRERRRALGLRDVRLTLPDARSQAVRERVQTQVAALNRNFEREAQAWIEAVSPFDEPEAKQP